MAIPWPQAFAERMERLLGAADWTAFQAVQDEPLCRGLRVNPLKMTAARLADALPFPLVRVPFAPDGFAVPPGFRAGADPLHHAGAYYMQEPSAMSAVTILAPRPGERVLDLCAAPGGKTTQIAGALRGQGIIWANEVVRTRIPALCQNLERCGVRNAVVSCRDVQTLCSALPGWFDAVLVDAPCSGEGMFRKEPAALADWSLDAVRHCAARQRDILRAAATAVRPGGRLCYSTCTFAPEEDECQVAAFLAEHPDFELVDSGVTFGRPGFAWDRVRDFGAEAGEAVPDLTRCRRIFPADGGEGHFVALFRRCGDPSPINRPVYTVLCKNTYSIQFNSLYKECFADAPHGCLAQFDDRLRLLPEGMPAPDGLGVVAAGIAAADLCKNRLEPCHALFMASAAADCTSCLDLAPADPRVRAFLQGNPIEAPGHSGWTAVAVCGAVTGFGKAGGGILKNRYPKGLRLRGAQG